MPISEAGKKISATYLQKAMHYDSYKDWLDDLVAQGKTSGPDQSESFVHYTQLTQQRMHRLDKTTVVLPEAAALISAIQKPQTWLVLTEAWCGDAAQSIPVMNALAKINPLIDLRLLMRDENPELMDLYLTNGVSRSIPKLIAVDTVSLEELFTWGPRPVPLQELFVKLKADNVPFAAMKEEFQRWYNSDKTATIQQELSGLAGGI